jgi:hypothetical protein
MDPHQQTRQDEAALSNGFLLTSSAPKAAEERQDQIFSFFQELREKQLQQQQQRELCRDHRYEVSNRSNIGGAPSSMRYLPGILN